MRRAASLILSLSAALFAGSCNHDGSGHGGGGSGGSSGSSGSGGNNGNGGSNGGGGSATCTASGACQTTCKGGGTTTLTGTVYAPNGTLPLYNAIVYIPSTTPDPFPQGATCDRCNGNISGNPIVQTLTGPDGTFSLPNVPVGDNVPLVVQLGKWRRTVTLASVPSCVSTPVIADNTRLPKNSSEGDIPKIAIVTGQADPMECLLLKIGLDPAEIQEPAANKRISFFQGANKPGTTMSAATPVGTQLYGSEATLMTYDLVMLPCEGGEFNQGATNVANIASYVNAGGRVFSTHYSYDWWHYANSPFEAVATWQPGQADDYSSATGIQGVLNETFPKGMAFAQWLIAAGVSASSPSGQLNIIQGRHDVSAVLGATQSWINFNTFPANSNKETPPGVVSPGVMHLTFNTPIDAPPDDMGNPQYCGRAVFSDFHVTTDALVSGAAGKTFPGACVTPYTLSDQEKALAFMLFDLSSCVQSDTTIPIS